MTNKKEIVDRIEKITTPACQRFAELQHALRKIGINGEADTGHYKYQYITLLDLRLALDAPLKKYGFYFTQPLDIAITPTGTVHNILRTKIYDANSGKLFLESSILLKPVRENNPQDVGSDITYMRRYSLVSILGLVGDKDTDCLLSDVEIEEGVRHATTPSELKALYDGIRKEQRDKFKDLFNNRILEFREEQDSQDKEVVESSSIK